MANMMDIGRSGLAAYRSALAVTGENIANVETEGYVKRTAVMREAGASGGVEIVDIGREFNNLLADRSRNAQTSVEASQTYLTHMKSLEDRLLPSVNGVSQLLDGFFDALDSVSMSPSNMGLRNTAMSSGNALAGGISDLAVGLQTLATNVENEMNQSIGQANLLLDELGEVQYQMGQLSKSGTQNALTDQRDRLLNQLGSLVQINVSTDERNLATIRLSADNGGPLLLAGITNARLSGDATGRLTVKPADSKMPSISRMPEGGKMGGLAQAAGTIGQSIADLDNWSSLIAKQMNAVHVQGVTPDGEPGVNLFNTSGWTATPGSLMRGDAVASVVVVDPTLMPDSSLNLVYDEPQSRWNLTSNDGDILATGTQDIEFSGLSIQLNGTPMDGDRIALNRHDGAARFLTFQLTQPEQIAAAGALTASGSPDNQGTAALSVKATTTLPIELPDLTAQFTDRASEFLKSGVVGVIPAGSGAVDLLAQPRLDSFEAGLPTGSALESLRVTTATQDFDFTIPAGLDLSGALARLNDGSITSDQGDSMPDLGMVLQTVDQVLALSVREGETPPLAISVTTNAGTVAAQKVADASPAAALSVFTRDGQQLSGPPIGAEAAANLLTTENGFDSQAFYGTDYLSADTNFAGLIRNQSMGAGSFAAVVGTQGGLTVWPVGQQVPETDGQQLSFEGEGLNKTVALPQGASAAWRAQILNSELPLGVKAETRLSLDLPTSGKLSLRVAGENLNVISLDVDLSSVGAAGLAQAFNAMTNSTGIRAEISANGGGVELVQSQGADITLEQITHDTGLPLSITRLGPNGETLDTIGLATDGGQSVRVAGTLSLTGSASFGVFDGTDLVEAQQDPFKGGLMGLNFGPGRDTAELTINDPGPDDLASRSINVVGGDGRPLQAQANSTEVSAPALAKDLIADLRSGAPASRLSGAAVSSLPPDGAMMRVSLGSDDYSITMTAGQPVVAGPEADRITASFDSSNALVIETQGGTLDGAALRLPVDTGEAARFGMGATQGPITTVIGQPFNAANLPASFVIQLEGVEYSVSVSTAGIIMPPTFPGTGRINTAYGTIEIQFDANGGSFAIPAQQGAADVGLDTADLTVSLQNNTINLTATDGRALNITSASSGTGTALHISNRQNEDLLVVLSGDGALSLSGKVESEPSQTRPQEIRVLDAEQGIIGLFDLETDTHLATRMLDADQTATIGGVSVTLSGTAETGDRFTLTYNNGATGDARAIEDLANLRQRDNQTEMGGYGTLFASLQQRVGTQVNAAQIRYDNTVTEGESAELALSQLAGVDLDAEAARLMQQQQAYQANAQVLSTAREIFDTLLAAI